MFSRIDARRYHINSRCYIAVHDDPIHSDGGEQKAQCSALHLNETRVEEKDKLSKSLRQLLSQHKMAPSTHFIRITSEGTGEDDVGSDEKQLEDEDNRNDAINKSNHGDTVNKSIEKANWPLSVKKCVVFGIFLLISLSSSLFSGRKTTSVSSVPRIEQEREKWLCLLDSWNPIEPLHEVQTFLSDVIAKRLDGICIVTIIRSIFAKGQKTTTFKSLCKN